jgi:glutathionylspermidine synthase
MDDLEDSITVTYLQDAAQQAGFLAGASTLWIEPPWKMLLSNKGILPVLWELYPGHPNLLEAHFDGPGPLTSWVQKPLLGREGANITLHRPGEDFRTGGEYGAEGFVYQDMARIESFDGKYPVVGSWLIGHTYHHQLKPVCAAPVRLTA